MLIKKASIYYNTIKYLKFQQIFYRIIRGIFPLSLLSSNRKIIPILRKHETKWNQVIIPQSPIIDESPLTFVFLNTRRTIVNPDDWNAKNHEKLWLYNLHYHSALLANIPLSQKESLIHLWIDQNPWPKGVGWEPYPLSLRIVCWIKFAFISSTFRNEVMNNNLYLQCLSLERQIEYHLQGNHLFENGKALLFAGIYFETKESHRWLKKGISILTKQIKEQILEDGGHFERTPMYHTIILEGLLDIYQLIHNYKENIPNKIKPSFNKLENLVHLQIPKMQQWLSLLLHRDGKISFFNDSTFEIASDPQAISNYASALGFSPIPNKYSFHMLKESGFVRAENKDALILANVGSIAPNYIPGHAHAESLCFEVSFGSERLFVNNGISTYTSSAERLYQRSTLAHNTIEIDGENSSQIWSSFRVGLRARVFDINFETNEEKIYFSASHNGYKRLASNIIHTREWTLENKKLSLKDTLKGKGNPKIISTLHFHPHWSILSQESNVFILQSAQTSRRIKLTIPLHSKATLDPFQYAIGFNNKIEGLCMRMRITNNDMPYSFETHVEW